MLITVLLALIADHTALSVWINGVAINIDINKHYNPDDAVYEIRLLDTDHRIAKKASCLAIYDHVTSSDEVKSIIEGCKACKDSCDDVAPLNRIKCGQGNVLKEECEAQNCCFDDIFLKGPKCFIRPATQCKHDVKDRENCGYNGIGKQNCLRRRCCWDKSQERGTHCFYEKGAVKNDCYNIPKSRRVKCGQSGIGEKECQQLNCCFDATVLNAIKCFAKQSMQ